MLCIHPTPSEEYRSTITYESVYFKSGLDRNEADWKILDWELGALFYGIKEGTGDPERAKADVMKKYGDEFLSDMKDLYLYMGTINGSQKRKFPNPWTIIGVAPFPKVSVRQQDLFFAQENLK